MINKGLPSLKLN